MSEVFPLEGGQSFSRTFEIVTPGYKYFDELLGLKCRDDLLPLNFFPNAKEITESFGAYHAVRKHLKEQVRFSDPNARCVIVGDGNSPRTGALFAFRSSWDIYSVDPRFTTSHMTTARLKVDRLHTLKDRIENTEVLNFQGVSRVVIVNVHSHAQPEHLEKFLTQLGSTPTSVVSIDCCVPYKTLEGKHPDVVYDDYNIWSPKRTVKVWRNV